MKPFVKGFLQANNLPENTPMTTLQQNKAFKYAGTSVAIKYSQMNLLGVSRQAAPIENRSYNSIIIANTPASDIKAVPPNPSKPWLEMYTTDMDPVCFISW